MHVVSPKIENMTAVLAMHVLYVLVVGSLFRRVKCHYFKTIENDHYGPLMVVTHLDSTAFIYVGPILYFLNTSHLITIRLLVDVNFEN